MGGLQGRNGIDRTMTRVVIAFRVGLGILVVLALAVRVLSAV